MSQPPGVSRQILVVDDNVDSAVAFSVFLEHSGHRTRVAHDGMAALAVANEFRPDVILLDIGLPGMDGHETARAIRQQPWAKELTIIATSGWGQESDKQRSRDVGIDHHLVKPVDLSALMQLLSTLPTTAAADRGSQPEGETSTDRSPHRQS
jgi:CheY-like chemotaxis protein